MYYGRITKLTLTRWELVSILPGKLKLKYNYYMVRVHKLNQTAQYSNGTWLYCQLHHNNGLDWNEVLFTRVQNFTKDLEDRHYVLTTKWIESSSNRYTDVLVNYRNYLNSSKEYNRFSHRMGKTKKQYLHLLPRLSGSTKRIHDF